MAEGSPNRFKTLQEKEKLLIMSNFSFSQSVFKRLILQTHKHLGLFEKGLTESHDSVYMISELHGSVDNLSESHYSAYNI